MKIEYKYELIIDGKVVTRLFADSRQELKKIIDICKYHEERYIKKRVMTFD